MSRAPDVDYSATSQRPDWGSLPTALHDALAVALGTQIAAVARPVSSGFTGGFAARVQLSDGRNVFIKAAPDTTHAFEAYQREAEVVPQLPKAVRAPEIITTVHIDEWFGVVSEWVEGRMPGDPWTGEDFARVTAACEEMAEALRPSPLDGLRMYGELVGDDITVPDNTTGLQDWVPRVLPELAELAAAGPDVLVGDTAMHSDLRPDNLLIDTHGVCWAVDWNWLTLGPRWVDWAGLLPLAQYHGIDTFAAVTSSPLTADVPKDDLDVFMAVIAAYMMKNLDAPPPLGCTPALREHQRLSAWTFLDWLAVRRGW